MKFIGTHVSAGGGMGFVPVNAHEIGANVLTLSTKNQRQWVAKPLTQGSIFLFKENCGRYALDARYILPYDSYLINLGHPEEEGLEKGRTTFLGGMQRYGELDLELLNFHPGNYLNEISVETCLDRTAKSINITLGKTQDVMTVIKDTAGQGNNVGNEFQHLKYITDRVKGKSHVDVRLDTRHMYTAGYDIVSKYDEVFEDFDKIVNFDFLRAIHLSDSREALGVRMNRHGNIGKRPVGVDFFKRFMKDERFNSMPTIFGTPNESLWVEEIRLLRSPE